MPVKLDFITPTTLKVLEFFFAHPAAEYYEREVLRRVKISKGSANKILRQTASLALLIREEKGRMERKLTKMRPDRKLVVKEIAAALIFMTACAWT